MQRSLPLILIAILSSLESTSSQQPTRLNNLLKKDISIPAREALPAMYVGNILMATGLRAGLEEKDDSCASAPAHSFPDFHGNIEAALDSVASPDGGHYVWQGQHGILFVHTVPAKPSLLDAKILSFSFDINENPLIIQDRLFDLPEVRKRAAELRLYERGPEIGFSQPKRPESGKPPVVVQHVSLRDALTILTAKHRDRLVWSYVEYMCSGTTYSQFNWLSK